MIEKEYYRLDELEKRFDLSFSDVLYLVENSKLDLAFRLADNKFIIGGWAKGNGFIGYASVKYSGFASITQKDQLTLLSKHKTNCKYFWLLNKDKIVSANYDYPFESKTPNTFLHTWQPKQPSDISWDKIPAKLFPKEQEHTLHSFKNAMTNTFKALGAEQSKPNEYEKEFDARIPKVQFYSEGINFGLTDICILHTDLVKAGITNKLEVVIPPIPTSSQLNQTPKTRTDDFHDLLIRLVDAEPELTAKEYWRLLENEAEDIEGFRVFDKYNLLIEVSGNHIKWQDRNKKIRKSISFSSFSNRLTKVRKSS
ncbi:hypothetical protein [Pseudoalteromonas sp. NZS37]|uniref:hypothetical protein n=1 Tax=Pseudoalteromonas sp. NZS37 TaxID=2792071 RepID=UPI0018CE9A93|nr:hypothetical protein [Pseudoalteromonas sp. NZS37]MBG9989645.1 hypothetical protein [Pseudoalteromonas sp. NZS37]